MNDHSVRDAAALDSLLGRLADEFLTRLERGEDPDIEAYADAHPEAATLIRQALGALRAVRTAPPAGSGEDAHAGAEPPMTGCLGGDYWIVREVGRGGMGIVYEAEQMSLSRRVALKVLPFAAALDARQLARFKNEAQAVAQLHHTNIVPVYAVGSDRGVHFYAMQFIDGRSLAAVIGELRQLAGMPARAGTPTPITAPEARPDAGAAGEPTRSAGALATEYPIDGPEFFRTVARLGAQAAEALEYAHGEGVIHRDVKPANLLLSSRGNLWVADFGLARISRDSGLTMTGDVVGTLRYMSPEQALGKRGLVDQRSDVYSLGATLYELLTLEPPFDADDRNELLCCIAFTDPRPPRQARKTVPVDLETVVLKAMAKAPEERYQTAGELADDLRRFLEHKPVLAKRPTLTRRIAKWARRHRAVVAAATVLLALAVLALAIGAWLIWREQGKTQTALEEARENLRWSDEAVDDMYTQVAEQWLAKEPHLEPVQRDFLLKALHYYQHQARRRESDPATLQRTAQAYFRVGRIQLLLGHPGLSQEAADQVVAVASRLVERFPHVPAYQLDLAQGHKLRASILHAANRRGEAARAARRAVDLLRPVAEGPDARRELAGANSILASSLASLGENAEAERLHREAAAEADRVATEFPEPVVNQRVLAVCLIEQARFLRRRGRLVETEPIYLRARDLLRPRADGYPRAPFERRNLAACLNDLGLLVRDLGRTGEAEGYLQQALDLRARLAADFPIIPRYRDAEAETRVDLAKVLASTGRAKEAEPAFRAALTLLEKRVSDSPDVPSHQLALARALEGLAVALARQGKPAGPCRDLLERAEQHRQKALKTRPGHLPTRQFGLSVYRNLGQELKRLGKQDDARRAYEQGIALAADLVRESPGVPGHHSELGANRNNLATMLLYLQGNPAEARRLLEQAVESQQEARKINSAHPTYRQYLLIHYRNLAEALVRLGEHAGAARTAEAALPIAKGQQEHVRAAGFLARCGPLAARDEQLSPAQRREREEAYAARAVELLREAIEHKATTAEALKNQPAFKPLLAREDFQKLLRE